MQRYQKDEVKHGVVRKKAENWKHNYKLILEKLAKRMSGVCNNKMCEKYQTSFWQMCKRSDELSERNHRVWKWQGTDQDNSHEEKNRYVEDYRTSAHEELKTQSSSIPVNRWTNL